MQLSLFERFSAAFIKTPDADRVAFLTAQPFAHRGLHGGQIIENSRAACQAAIDARHGVELDVMLARDGEPFVFHDHHLDRLTVEFGPVNARNGATLSTVKLLGTEETIPRLSECLALIGGQVPLLIEIKHQGINTGPICLAVRRALEGYRGDVAVMSFNPRVSHWFANHAPRLVRGLSVQPPSATNNLGQWKHAISCLRALWQAQVEFIAHDITYLPSALSRLARRRGLPVLAWTVKTAAQEQTALAHANEMIYERA